MSCRFFLSHTHSELISIVICSSLLVREKNSVVGRSYGFINDYRRLKLLLLVPHLLLHLYSSHIELPYLSWTIHAQTWRLSAFRRLLWWVDHLLRWLLTWVLHLNFLLLVEQLLFLLLSRDADSCLRLLLFLQVMCIYEASINIGVEHL